METVTAIDFTDETEVELNDNDVDDYIYTLCLQDLRKRSILLTKEEEKRLFEELAISTTDEEREKIIYRIWAANVRLSIKVAEKFSWIFKNHPEVSLMDLVNEGAIGIKTAIFKFDITRGCKFSTYAYFWIYQAMMRAIQNYLVDVIRLPVHVQEKLNRMAEILQEYEGREIDFAKKIRGIEEAFEMRKPLSLNKKLTLEGANDELGDILSDPNALSPLEEVICSDTREKIGNAMKGLNRREKEVIILRFGLDGLGPRTLEEIARMFGVCRERIRQIEKKAINKMQHPTRVERLKELL